MKNDTNFNMVREGLKRLPRRLVVAFGARAVLRVLPTLVCGMGNGRPFLPFWKEDDRYDHLLSVFRAQQVAWGVAGIQDAYSVDTSYCVPSRIAAEYCARAASEVESVASFW